MDRTEIIESLESATRVENVKLINPGYRLELDRTSKRNQLFSNTLQIFKDNPDITPFY